MRTDKLPSILWLYGLPSAGKTTLARALRNRLQADDIAVEMLDGDELRKKPCKDLGFSDDDRMENLRRAAHLALTASGQGRMVIAAFVTPKKRHRARIQKYMWQSAGNLSSGHLCVESRSALTRCALLMNHSRLSIQEVASNAGIGDKHNAFFQPA